MLPGSSYKAAYTHSSGGSARVPFHSLFFPLFSRIVGRYRKNNNNNKKKKTGPRTSRLTGLPAKLPQVKRVRFCCFVSLGGAGREGPPGWLAFVRTVGRRKDDGPSRRDRWSESDCCLIWVAIMQMWLDEPTCANVKRSDRRKCYTQRPSPFCPPLWLPASRVVVMEWISISSLWCHSSDSAPSAFYLFFFLLPFSTTTSAASFSYRILVPTPSCTVQSPVTSPWSKGTRIHHFSSFSCVRARALFLIWNIFSQLCDFFYYFAFFFRFFKYAFPLDCARLISLPVPYLWHVANFFFQGKKQTFRKKK